ncbi:hypothetical protein EOPP23_10920 [Endozoicomonas sp. OPT23]|uniref:FxsA family protein n=1 Tax=Endozoicomonas sp. OPT23 TaxID=2072845 RepID=UPI00129B67AB|nr:FxsA family protein [Endozoicomonas sp. OPT23]MRI33497.1 hypothetical protein [Endozoicomonas sp. OPT23]
MRFFPLFFFVVLPILEMITLIKVGGSIGALNTVALVILGMFAGGTIIRTEGVKTLMKAREKMNFGEMPAVEMLEGLMIAIGGLFLIFPGFITDFFGILLLIPFVRKLILSRMIKSGRWKFQQSSQTYDAEYYREDVDVNRTINHTLDGDFKRDDDHKY